MSEASAYIIMTENKTYAAYCSHRWQAELFAFGIGLLTWIRLNPQRIHVISLGAFSRARFDAWAKEMRGASATHAPKGEGE